MTFSDIISIAFGNLWRMKLRSFLTISGVVIGIAALVSMMSFGAGMQKNVSEAFKSMAIFSTITVLPAEMMEQAEGDSSVQKKLNDAAIEEISQFPGVKIVYPEDTFPVRVKFGEEYASATAEAIPASMGDVITKGQKIAGEFFTSDTAKEVVIHNRLLNRLNIEDADSIVGKDIEIISAQIDISSAFSMMSGRKSAPFKERIYTFKVVGVMGQDHDMSFDIQNLIIPYETAQGISRLGFSSAFDLLSKVSKADEEKQYSTLTVRLNSSDDHEAVKDSLDSIGYRTFSLSDQFDEIRRAFLIFDLILGVVGFIALVVASLGIVNTLVMSIIERYKEIGILKSLGASDGDIRLLFLIESSSIGFVGALFGLLFGWVVSRIASAVAMMLMVREGSPAVDFFYLPVWLIVLAMMFGTVVALLAGLYPSGRAAKVDPVQSLRHN